MPRWLIIAGIAIVAIVVAGVINTYLGVTLLLGGITAALVLGWRRTSGLRSGWPAVASIGLTVVLLGAAGLFAITTAYGALITVGVVPAPSDAPEPTVVPSEVAQQPTEDPSPTVEPTETAAPTSEPTPEETPPPTPKPTARPTLEPTPRPTPEVDFAPIRLSGVGDAVKRFKIPSSAVALATITHSGTSNFAVWTVDRSGAKTDLLVNEIGKYRGTVLFDEQGHSVAMSIEADGAWNITIKPIQQARVWHGTGDVAGRGDSVLSLQPPSSGLASTRIRHDGSSNFAVWAFSSSYGQELLVNEIGRYDGEVLLSDGTALFEITADGGWSMTALK